MYVELAATFAATFLIVLEEWKVGKGREVLKRRREGRSEADVAHQEIPRIAKKIDALDEKIDERCDRLEDHVEENRQIVAYLHSEELKNDPLARHQLDVEVDDDILGD